MASNLNDEKLHEICAHAAHEANRAHRASIGEDPGPVWADAPEWMRSSTLNGVVGALGGNSPEQLHLSWLEEKRRTGWKYGPVKDPEKKEHPCFLPYDELPLQQRVKDRLFVSVVRAVASTITAAMVGLA